MAKYLVTGGCGFIGSHLAYSLVEDGHDVVILDNLSTGHIENAPSRARVIIEDATNYSAVEEAMRDIDGCFHLAAVASVEKSRLEWTKTHSVNITATVNIFQAASQRNIPVVYTSSAAVYGDNPAIPLSEQSSTAPLTAYGADKLGCELHGKVAWLVHRIPNIGIRPFNVYGPRQDPHSPYSGVISIFVNRIAGKLPITIFGDGEQRRDFIYVGDIVQIFRAAMDRLFFWQGYDVMNACTGNATTVNSLIGFIESIYGWNVLKEYAEARKGDIRLSLGNPEKAYNMLGVRANTGLIEGLALMIGKPVADIFTPDLAAQAIASLDAEIDDMEEIPQRASA